MRWLTDSRKLRNETRAPVADRNPGFRVKAEPQDGVMRRVKWMEPMDGATLSDTLRNQRQVCGLRDRVRAWNCVLVL